MKMTGQFFIFLTMDKVSIVVSGVNMPTRLPQNISMPSRKTLLKVDDRRY